MTERVERVHTETVATRERRERNAVNEKRERALASASRKAEDI